jgi:malate dehydrogenase (oxaloacetate-decarboxylating)(NADP+)
MVEQVGIARPIVLGKPEDIRKLAEKHEIDLKGITIIEPISSPKLESYADAYYKRRARKGVTQEKARQMMLSRTYFGIMMLAQGDCDAVLSGVTSDYPHTIRPALQIIDLNSGVTRVSGLYALVKDSKLYLFADTTVNINPTAEELAEIAIGAANVARGFNMKPRVAMLSFSNFGSAPLPESNKVARATRLVHEKAPELMVEGEMQLDTALMPGYLKRHFPFSRLTDEANVLIFPDLNSGNIAYKLALNLGGLKGIGPILMGLSKPVHVLHRTLDVGEIVDMAAIAVMDAQRH